MDLHHVFTVGLVSSLANNNQSCHDSLKNYTTTPGLFSNTTWVSQQKKRKTSLDLNEARDDGASAGPYANNLHLAPDR